MPVNVKTPLLSGIPYMFRFAAPRNPAATTIGEDRKMMRWAPLKIKNLESIGLKGRYLQAMFNPASIACIGLIVASFVLKTFFTSLIYATMSYEYLRCSASSLEASNYGTFYQYSEGVMQIANLSNSQAMEQYIYSVNATLWNLQASSHQYAGLLGAHYQTLISAVPGAAYLASTNVSNILGAWAQTELDNASNYTNKLLSNISAAMGELGGSAANVSGNITYDVPSAINTNLSNIWRHETDLYNLTQNTISQLDTLFAGAATNISLVFATMQTLPENMSITPPFYQTSGCLTVISQYQGIASKLGTQFKLQAALFALLSIIFMGVSVFYTSRKWRQKRIIISEMCTQSHTTPERATEQLNAYDTPLVVYLQSLLGKQPGRLVKTTKWIMAYFLTPFMVTVLSVGWMFIILSLCVSSMLRVANTTILVDLSSSLPQGVSVENSTLSISASGFNLQLAEIEKGINGNVTGILTSLITDVNSVLYTVNETMCNASTQTLQSVNLTGIPPGLQFDLIYENGIAMQDITLCRVPTKMNVTTGMQKVGIFDPGYAFGAHNVTQAGSQVQSALRTTGLAMVLMWCGALVISSLYVFAVPYCD